MVEGWQDQTERSLSCHPCPHRRSTSLLSQPAYRTWEERTSMQIVNSIGQALFTSFSMFWEILWPLMLGFTLSGIVQAVVSHNAMAKTLGCDGPKCLTFATLFGIASSSAPTRPLLLLVPS